MIVTKEGALLHFDKGEERFSYNFKDESFINPRGRVVKYPQNFFKGFSISKLKTEQDEKYLEFLKLIYNHYDRVTNIGTVLSRIKDHKIYESWVLLGYKCDEYNISIKPKDCNKIFLQYMKENNENITWSNVNNHIKYKWVVDLIKYVKDNKLNKVILNYCIFNYPQTFNTLVELGYEYKSLYDYLSNIVEFEAMYFRDAITFLKDYATMKNIMLGHMKFNKYPKCLHTNHDIIVKNYNAFKETHDEVVFYRMVDKSLEFESKPYSIITPKQSMDVKNEGICLNHCVSSYVKKIIEGETQVAFLRDSKKLEESLVTLEVRDNSIVQAKGYLNRKVNEQEDLFIQKYAKEKKLKYKGSDLDD